MLMGAVEKEVGEGRSKTRFRSAIEAMAAGEQRNAELSGTS